METAELTYLIQMIDDLKENINEIKSQLKEIDSKTQTPEGNKKELHNALAKAQSEMKVAQLTEENKYFKTPFADLVSIVNASRDALSKNGLSITQETRLNDKGQTYIDTVLRHSSGQSISCQMTLNPPANDIQSVHSHITYVRRMCYSAICGIVTEGEDDDGECSMANHRETMKKGVKLNTKYNPKEQTFEKISKDQLEELEYELSEYEDIAEQILDGLKLQSLADMPKSKYFRALQRIREIKKARNG